MTTGEVIALIKAFGGGGGGSSGGGVLLVHDVEGTLDKTWQEIHDAALTDVVILAGIDDNQITHRYLSETLISGDEYQVGFSNGESYYIASSASGYPVFGE